MSLSKKKAKKPKNTAFSQQRLKAWIPILQMKNVAPLLIVVGIAVLSVGIGIFMASDKLFEMEIDYTKCDEVDPSLGFTRVDAPKNVDEWKYEPASKLCSIKFTLPNLKGNILFYYKLTSFYQNFRRFEKSVSFRQLEGKALSFDELEADCYPLVGLSDKSKIYYPCGIRANSMFTDKFSVLFSTSNSSIIKFNNSVKQVTWFSDFDRFKSTEYSFDQILPPPDWHDFLGKETYTSQEDIFNIKESSRFINWMRSAHHSTFRKLLMTSEAAIPSSQYRININSYFDVKNFKGTKSFIITQTSWFGTKNMNLAIILSVFGSICLLNGILVLLGAFLKTSRQVGDRNFLNPVSKRKSNKVKKPVAAAAVVNIEETKEKQ